MAQAPKGGAPSGRANAAYIRVSTDEQAERGNSLPEQEDTSRGFVARGGWGDVDPGAPLRIYRDEGASGRTMDRPAFARLVADVEAGLVGHVIIPKPDRFARDGGEQSIPILRRWLRAGVRISFVSFNFQDTPQGWFLYRIQAAVNANEWDEIRDRTSKGRKKALDVGKWPFKAGFGYRRDPKAKMLAEHGEEANIIRRIFREAARREASCTELMQLFHREGVRGRSARPWTRAGIRQILRNPMYAGEALVLRTHTHGDKRDETHVRETTPKETWRRIPVPALVDRALFDRVQAMLDRRALPRFKRGRPSSTPALLRQGIGRCVCGSPLAPWRRGEQHGRQPRYRCQTRTEVTRCPAGTWHLPTVDAAIWSAFASFLADPTRLAKAWTKEREEHRTRSVEARGRHLARLKAVEGERARWIRLYGKGVLGEDELTGKIQGLDREARDLRQHVADADALLRAPADLGGFAGAAEAVKRLSKGASIEDRMKLFQTVCVRVILRADMAEVVLREDVERGSRVPPSPAPGHKWDLHRDGDITSGAEPAHVLLTVPLPAGPRAK